MYKLYRIILFVSTLSFFSLSADNFNAFIGAVRKGNVERMNRYIDTVDINKLKWSATPLYIAVHFEHLEIVKELVSRDCDVNIKCGSKQRTALQKAVSKKNKDIVMLLVDKADINITNNKNESPLHTAIIEDCEDIAVQLVQKGADTKIKAQAGVPAEVAKNLKRDWAIKLLS